jgi:hypothetical protein
MVSRQIMSVLWPAFLLACVLEMLVFGLVDPAEVFWIGKSMEVTRQTVYALAFLAFWLATAASSGLTLWLATKVGESEPG